MMVNRLFQVVDGGRIEARSSFIAKCGCSGVGSIMNKAFQKSTIRAHSINQVDPETNAMAKRFLTQEGYYKLFPSLNNSTFVVVINPTKKSGIDLVLNQNSETIGQDIMELLSV